jgi:hypothetical protein
MVESGGPLFVAGAVIMIVGLLSAAATAERIGRPPSSIRWSGDVGRWSVPRPPEKRDKRNASLGILSRCRFEIEGGL